MRRPARSDSDSMPSDGSGGSVSPARSATTNVRLRGGEPIALVLTTSDLASGVQSISQVEPPHRRTVGLPGVVGNAVFSWLESMPPADATCATIQASSGETLIRNT